MAFDDALSIRVKVLKQSRQFRSFLNAAKADVEGDSCFQHIGVKSESRVDAVQSEVGLLGQPNV